MTAPELAAICDPYDGSPTECDGMTLLLHAALTKAGVEHRCMCGAIMNRKALLVHPAHLWIEAGDFIVDYRLRFWLGKTAPHGVFDQATMAQSGCEYYKAKAVELVVPNEAVLQILQTPLSAFFKPTS